MRKLHVLGAVLAALFAFGVLTAASASAVTFLLAEWLVGGTGTTTTQLVDTEGTVALKETVLGQNVEVLCTGIFDGSIGPNGADEITEVLTVGGTLIAKELEEPGLACTDDLGTCPEPLAWAVGLPYLTLAELMVDGTEEFMVDLLAGDKGQEIGYHVECMKGIINDLCVTTQSVTKLTNEANGTVHGEFSEAFTELAGLKLANCEVAGNEKGIVEGLGFTLLTAGGTLAVSE